MAKTTAPLATVDGQAISEEDLLPQIQAQLRPLQNQEFEIKSRALEAVIQQRLLEAQAKKQGLTTEKLLEQEVDSRISDPTDAEVEAFYLGQKDRLNRPLAEVKAQLASGLKQARVQQARQEYLKSLRDKAQVTIRLSRPRVQVAVNPERLRGSAKAPVTIVEFSDFQCPYCRRTQSTLQQLLAKYGDRVSLSFRDYPLRQIHPLAQLAAEAARCAGEQAKFWEYHDALFTAPKLDRDGLVEQARAVKLDDGKFEACLSAGTYKAQIEQDLQEGTRAGVNGTPAFFINGILLSGAQPLEAFSAIVDDELSRPAVAAAKAGGQ